MQKETVTQSELLELVLKLSKGHKLALISFSHNSDIEGNVMCDGMGNLCCPSFSTNDIRLTMDFTMKRQAFLEISEIIGRLVRE